MQQETHCFGCDGKFGGYDGVACSKRSSFLEFSEDVTIDGEDLLEIREFYFYRNKSLETPLCWECALCRVLEYTSKYSEKLMEEGDESDEDDEGEGGDEDVGGDEGDEGDEGDDGIECSERDEHVRGDGGDECSEGNEGNEGDT